MPRTLALMAVQRHAATSRSTRSLIRLQHGRVGGDPNLTLTKFNTLAHTPNLSASIGHAPFWQGTDGSGITGMQVELTMVQESMLRQRNIATTQVDATVPLEAISVNTEKKSNKFGESQRSVRGVLQVTNLVVFWWICFKLVVRRTREPLIIIEMLHQLAPWLGNTRDHMRSYVPTKLYSYSFCFHFIRQNSHKD